MSKSKRLTDNRLYQTSGRRKRKHIIWDDLVFGRYGAHGRRYWTKWERRQGKREIAAQSLTPITTPVLIVGVVEV